MVPEFFLRGKKGAYTFEHMQLARQKLQNIVSDKAFGNWIFVFGSIVGYSDVVQNNWLKRLLGLCKQKEIYNVVLVQQGGFGDPQKAYESAHIVMKEYMSNIDFFDSITYSMGVHSYIHLPSGKAGIEKEVQQHNYDGLSIFKNNAITFGVEICLDHRVKRIKKSPRLPGKEQVAVQLIPSCGMRICDDSVVVQEDGYVFNVDGSQFPICDLRKMDKGDLTLVGKSAPIDVDSNLTDTQIEKLYPSGKGEVIIFNVGDKPEPVLEAGTTVWYRNEAIGTEGKGFDQTSDEKFVFDYLVIYDKDNNYQDTLMTIHFLDDGYATEPEVLPIKGSLLGNEIALKAEVKPVNLENGDDRMIFIDFMCDGYHVIGGYVSFKSKR